MLSGPIEQLSIDQRIKVVHAEEVEECHDYLAMQVKGTKLRNKAGMFGTSDPYFVISRVREDGAYTPVLRSPTIMNNLSPIWPLQHISAQQLCNGDMDRPLKIDIYDWINNGNDIHMGEAVTTARAMVSSS